MAPPRLRVLASLAIVASLAGCHDKPAPAPEPTSNAPMASAIPQPGDGGGASGAPSSAALASPPPAPGFTPPPRNASVDLGALAERRDPDRLLRFYADALRQGEWGLAARAWRAHAGVTGATLRASYDRGQPVALSFGRGDQEGGAGSIYYEVPVTLRFGASGAPQTGTLTLRRVNDVPGATAEQLDWRIERSTIGATQ